MIREVGQLIFGCDNPLETWRADTFYTKEPGTLKWIDENVREGTIFFDVGANIGVYSLYAAKRGALVHAFEPHVGNAWRLMRNVLINELQDRITVVTAPLHSRHGVFALSCASLMSGSSGHQVDCSESMKIRELKYCCTLDDFLPLVPDMIKIDVDGNELLVLQGGDKMLDKMSGELQVEVHPQNSEYIRNHLINLGYTELHHHYTETGKKQIDEGADPKEVICNSVFQKVA